MQYLLAFLEGIITFVSPCLLPMLPVYLSYFAGEAARTGAGGRRAEQHKHEREAEHKPQRVDDDGAAAGTLGGFLRAHSRAFEIAGGALLVVFGLNFMGLLPVGFLNRTLRLDVHVKAVRFGTSVLLGLVFAVGWTPCVGATLGAALMLAAAQQTMLRGVTMLLLFSAGLGIPFLLCALLLDALRDALAFLRRHLRAVSLVSGGLLVLLGVLMALGLLSSLFSLFPKI